MNTILIIKNKAWYTLRYSIIPVYWEFRAQLTVRIPKFLKTRDWRYLSPYHSKAVKKEISDVCGVCRKKSDYLCGGWCMSCH